MRMVYKPHMFNPYNENITFLKNDIIKLLIDNEKCINFYYNTKLLSKTKIGSNENYYFAISIGRDSKIEIC